MSLQILQAREQRWQHKLALAERYSETIVSLALNVPGPNKYLPGVQEAFTALEHALHCIIDQLPAEALLHDSASQLSADGPYLLLAVKTAPLTLKRQLAELEETHPLGRLADLDVYSKAFGPVSRSDINLPPRSCFLCGNQAAVCRRTQTHSAEEIIAFARAQFAQAAIMYPCVTESSKMWNINTVIASQPEITAANKAGADNADANSNDSCNAVVSKHVQGKLAASLPNTGIAYPKGGA